MAQLIIEIPDVQLPRVITAFGALVQEGDAVDVENPTNQEIVIIVKTYISNALIRRVNDYEKVIHTSEFTPVSLDIL